MADDAALASGFAPPTRQDWLAAVGRALKGGDFERSLVSSTLDGIRVEPLYTGEPYSPRGEAAPLPVRSEGAWDIRTTVSDPDPRTANAQALADLANGATSVDLAVYRPGDLGTLLSGIVLDAAPVALRPYCDPVEAAEAFLRLAPAAASGCLGIDPTGGETLERAVPLGRRVAESGSALRTFRISGATVADAGASEAQEIGFLLASATACLRALCGAGLTAAHAARQVDLEVTADVDIFLTTAKLRALRHAWACVLRESGVDPAGVIHLSAVSSYRTLTVVDPWVNMLRGTAACLGAVLGGADTVTIAGFDGVDAAPGELGRRIARNTQSILQSESAIGRVQDPAAGSWYVESLTDELAEHGWRVFQRIEAAGGPVEAMPALAEDIRVVAQRRAADIARRKRQITGVTEFPLLGEQRPDRKALPQHDAGPLPRRRLAEPFEELRAHGEARGFTIFLANLGPASAHTARSTFAANLFAVGGVASAAAAVDAGSAARAFAESGAAVACLCSSDAVYAEQAEAVAAALRDAGARRIYLAGRAEAVGVDENIAVGVDVLDVLTRLHRSLEAS